MRNIFLIAKREYLERVRTKSFIVMTFLIPALMLGVTVLPTYLMTHGSSEAKHITVVASDKKTADLIQQELSKAREEEKQPAAESPDGLDRPQSANLSVDVDLDTSDKEHATLVEKVQQKQLDGVVFATKEALAARKVAFVTRDVSSFIGNAQVKAGINRAVHLDLLKSKGLSEEEINNALQSVDLETQSPSGAVNPMRMFFTAFTMVMVLYMVVLLYGINVMRAILDEKTSRIMEVMLSIARAKEMMAGKILGVGSVALTQILIWTVVAGVLSSTALIAGAGMLKGILSPTLLIYFAVYFLLGFALYSTMYAAVGAMVNSEQEAQQLQFLVMMPMILSIVLMGSILQAPGSSIAVWASLFPFTSPLIMLVRVAVQPPPAWQIEVSIGLMVATIYGMVLLCSRIYRVGILMYGKKPTLPEIMKWIRYA
ncbi:MAG TPA: ABC transporter permease [Candidatus Angelobacter sp.]